MWLRNKGVEGVEKNYIPQLMMEGVKTQGLCNSLHANITIHMKKTFTVCGANMTNNENTNAF